MKDMFKKQSTKPTIKEALEIFKITQLKSDFVWITGDSAIECLEKEIKIQEESTTHDIGHHTLSVKGDEILDLVS